MSGNVEMDRRTGSTAKVQFKDTVSEFIIPETAPLHAEAQKTKKSYNLGNDEDEDDLLVRVPVGDFAGVGTGEGEAQLDALTPTAVAEASAATNRLACRYYSAKFPEVDSLVMVNVRQIADMGAYVHLLEYNDIEGMILLSELSRRRIRSIQKLIRVGRNEVVVVLRVDKEKGMRCFCFSYRETVVHTDS